MVAAIWHSLQYLYNFRVNFETLRYTKRSTLDPPLGTRWKAVIAPLPSAAWRKTSQPALHQFFPSREVTGIDWYMPSRSTEARSRNGPFSILLPCKLPVQYLWVTISLQCRSRKFRFLLLTDWESSPLPTQTCSNVSRSLYNAFIACRQFQQLTSTNPKKPRNSLFHVDRLQPDTYKPATGDRPVIRSFI